MASPIQVWNAVDKLMTANYELNRVAKGLDICKCIIDLELFISPFVLRHCLVL
jgi:hypothetical protein